MAGAFSWQNIPLVGSLFPNPNEQAKLDAMRRAGQVYQAQRPVMGQARMNALSNTMAAFAPVANAAALMYGPAGTPNTQMMLRNPYTGQAPPLEGGPAAAAPAPAAPPQGSGPRQLSSDTPSFMGMQNPFRNEGPPSMMGMRNPLRTDEFNQQQAAQAAAGASAGAAASAAGSAAAAERARREREAGRRKAESTERSTSGRISNFYR